jgi:HPt (histidine-containing phosphotransfer) domain-containing protein
MNEALEKPIYSQWQNDPIIHPLLTLFSEDLPSKINELADATHEKDWEVVKELTHQFRGAAATYGYPELATVFGEIERESKKDSINTDVVGTLLTQSRDLCDRINDGTKNDVENNIH